MHGDELIAIVFISGGIALGVVGIVAWTLVALIRGRPQQQAENVDESRLIQEIYHGLTKMERRVESLETLLLEREKRS